MAFAGKLMRAIVVAAGKIGVKKLAYAAGAQVGVGTYAEAAAGFGLDFVEDVCKYFGGSNREAAARLPVGEALDPAVQREIKSEVAAAAQADGQQMSAEMDNAIAEVAPDLPAEERERLRTFAAMLPERIRRTMQRAEDPSGRTIPESTQFRTPLDLAAILPPMPRFAAGQTPVYQCTLTRVLGVGTFGEVWEARKSGFQKRRVALKFCLGDDRALLHEANLAQQLEHKGIVGLLAIHERTESVPLCLEYEFVDGQDLAGWYFAQKITDADRPAFAAGVIAELAEIVAVAHAHVNDGGRPEPIVHRDLKPANVLVPHIANVLVPHAGECGRPARPFSDGASRFKITDFGIGGIIRAAEDAAANTQQRAAGRYGSSYTLDALQAYTPRYAPDEQVAGGAADPRQDIHALGVIWYQLLKRDFTLAAPRGGGWRRQLRERGVADAHLELIERCVDSDPSERPGNAAILAEQIRAANESRVGSAHHAGSTSSNLSGNHDMVGKAHPTQTPETESRRIVMPAEPKVATPPKPKIIAARFPMTEIEASEVQAEAARALGVPVMETLNLGGGVTLDMMLIPAGEFLMGGDQSPEEVARLSDTKPEYFKNEHPRHRVRISSPFRLGRFQVTQAQWQRAMGNNPSHFKGDGKLPVEQVSWDECRQFCEKLSRDVAREFNLPTEAQWEYACRSGTGTPFHFGDTISTKQANFDGNYKYGSGGKGKYRQKTTPVGSFPANGWGLHDMHGNVWEWCASWFGIYEAGEKVDPVDSGSGSVRVLRGGSWFSNPWYCRSACRGANSPVFRNNGYGFRVASGTQ